VGVNTWDGEKGARAVKSGGGLDHTGVLYPAREGLAKILGRLLQKKYPITGMADHGVSEAI